jgi:glycosyltransferase EpsE
MKAPLATAMMTVYNGETWLEQAVRSLLGQSLRDVEILVIDDGSTDRTVEILDSFDDDRLRVVHRSRSGRAASLALAATLAGGKYLANLDADDEAFPERLERQVAFLEKHPDYGWVGSGEEREDSQRNEHVMRLYPETDEAIRRQAAKCIPYCHSAVMFRRELVLGGVNYDPAQKYLIDFEFFLRVAKRCKVANLPEVLVKRRLRNESYFQANFTRARQNARLAWLCGKAIRQFGLPLSCYMFPLARLGYPLVPNFLKRRVRANSGLIETDWSQG